MTNEQIEAIESITLSLAGGGAVVYPPSAPFVSAIKLLIKELHPSVIGTPYELSAEQAGAIAAGVAAMKSSAATHVMEKAMREARGVDHIDSQGFICQHSECVICKEIERQRG